MITFVLEYKLLNKTRPPPITGR